MVLYRKLWNFDLRRKKKVLYLKPYEIFTVQKKYGILYYTKTTLTVERRFIIEKTTVL